MKARASSVLLALLLAGCAARTGAPAPVEYGGGQASPPRAEMQSGRSLTVAKGDTVYSLAKRHNVTLPALLSANNLSPPYRLTVGQRLNLPSSGQYVVARSDTLYGIARMHGLTPQTVIAANGLKPPYELKTGQRLSIPAGGNTQAGLAAAPSRGTGLVEAAPPPPPASAVPARDRGVEAAALPSPVSKEPLAAPPETGKTAMPALAAPPPLSKSAAPPPLSKSAAQPPLIKPASAPEPSIDLPAASPPAVRTVKTGDASPLSKPPPRASREFAWPVKGKVVTSYGKSSKGVQNDGINISAPRGATVGAAENGVVAYVGSELKGFGNLVLVKHADGWVTAYAHADQVLVKRGDRVKRGQAIAKVGSSGNVDSPQLHFEIRKDSRPVDPTKVLGS